MLLLIAANLDYTINVLECLFKFLRKNLSLQPPYFKRNIKDNARKLNQDT